ncbi:trans-sulfuration enzyme family protein [Sulfitobacter donghicola]|uniref:Cystathionine gamma-synthase n=1 Tax=Sulfitobacter donghicola DSW-25 = KCTC 12864 = JCM 14565 TaxID=1300350 RepID=A0A073IXL6_9RHOB|nr:aminotransferase class I/II-fold pyridoxal phosphate-dependent enzyme [Sulfitobacter donghicola]KEJ90122.1 cystathionine gamma-synthase [Sulfitobacter donghicola DSW-25 = KCTC 12864 = JCM 14565]KIN66724.1 Cystathionine gamma-synthase [Sulfitobacter donghicola DSW-25 = KCTC 12864 = JCM 14565]
MSPKKMENFKPATVAAQAAGLLDDATGGVVPPIHPATTFVRDDNYEPAVDGNVYSRSHAPNGQMAEKILAQLEGAADAMVFPSGMAAVAAVFRTLATGASVLVQSQIYWGTTAWIRDFCARRDITLIEVEAADTASFQAACAEHKPALAWVETPSNPWLRIVDLQACAQAVHAAGGVLVADLTTATPIITQGLSFGADIVMHSATKALNGHSDVLAGALSCRDAQSDIWQAIRNDRNAAGAVLGPFEAWLLMRGMRTLPLRVERMSANAMKLAEYLSDHPSVETVLYPGLPTHDGHALASQQMKGGYGSLVSFVVKGGAEKALGAVKRLQLFHPATSLGGVESLVEHRHTIEPHTGIPEGLLRMSVGIEDAGDLIDDLAQALGQ